MSAIDAFHYEKRLRSRIDKLDDNLKAIRSVEEAKKLLMDAKHIGESSAYSLLRRSAMERRVRIAVVANEIIEAYKIIA
jgi:AmiR/NasT family two-component response regulator